MIIGIERTKDRVRVRAFGAKFRDFRSWVAEGSGRSVYEVDGRLLQGLADARHGWRTQVACHAAASICETRGRLLTTSRTASRRAA